MALPDYLKRALGTAITWAASGGDQTLTLTSLANNAGRQGGKADLGSAWSQEYLAIIESSVASAASNGLELELWWAASVNATAGTDNPGGLSGADGSVSNPDEVKYQCQFVGALPFSNGLGTAVQRTYKVFRPQSRYGFPVLVNKTGQALGATAGDHKVRLVPLQEVIADA